MASITSPERLAHLATDILMQSQKLLHLELESAKDELAPNWRKLKRVLYFSVFTVLVGLASVVLLSLMLTHFLVETTSMKPWISDAIVLIALLSVALCLFKVTQFYYRKLVFFPKRTVETLKDDLKCLKNQI